MNGQSDFSGLAPSRYFLPIASLLGLLFALISGDESGSKWVSLLQWQLQTLLPMAILILCHRGLSRVSLFARLNRWLALLVSGLIGASLFVPIAYAIDFWLGHGAGETLAAALWEEWVGVVPPVVVTWLALNAPWQLGYRLQRLESGEPAADGETGSEADAEFLELVPPEKRGRLRFLKSELHYLQVASDNGDALILYNLEDAVDALSPDQGMRVHRSYWVAFDAIEGFDRKGRQGQLRLKGGAVVPVSRRRLDDVSQKLTPILEPA